MRIQFIKVVAVVSIFGWIGLLAHQIYWLTTVYGAAAGHPTMTDFIDTFLASFGVSSSAQMLVTVAIGVTLSILVFVRRSAWAALGLFLLALLVFYQTYLDGISICFRPPLGDGSWQRAAAAWWKMYSSMIVVRGIEFAFLIGSLVFWIPAFLFLRSQCKKPGA